MVPQKSINNVIEQLNNMSSSEERVSFLKEHHEDDHFLMTILLAFHSPQVNFFISEMPEIELTEPRIMGLNHAKEQIGEPSKDTLFGAFYMAADTKSIPAFHEVLGMMRAFFEQEQRHDLIDFGNQLLTDGIDSGLTDEDLMTVWPSFFGNRLAIEPMKAAHTYDGLSSVTLSKPYFADVVKGERLLAFVTWNGDTPLVALRYIHGDTFVNPAICDEIGQFAVKVGEIKDGHPTRFIDGFILDGYVHKLYETHPSYSIIDMLDSLTKLRTGIDKRDLIDRRMPLISLGGPYVRETKHMLVESDTLDVMADLLDYPSRVMLRATDSIYECGKSDDAVVVHL